MYKRNILFSVKTNSFDLSFSFGESINAGEIKDSQELSFGTFHIHSKREVKP